LLPTSQPISLSLPKKNLLNRMRFASLDQWLAWMETCHPQVIELGLERIAHVARAMGLLHSGARRIARRIVTVAGTNGKGSCVAALDAMLRAHGLNVASYTSPHLVRYNERVRINGVEVDDARLCEAFAVVDAARGSTSLTYFEFGTLAAFHLFAQSQPDVVILEVGLGGRLDAVNLLDADIAVITSIALDHVDWLGSTREAIGGEKAGILRKGIDFICGETDPPASLEEAARINSTRNFFVGDAYQYEVSATGFSFRGRTGVGRVLEFQGLPVPSLPWPSVAMAVQALCLLDDMVVPDRSALAGVFATLALAGRFQRFLQDGVEIIVDVAHNPAGARFLCGQLQATPAAGRTLAVFTMLADKDLAGSIEEMKPAISAWFVAELPGVARARPARDVADALFKAGIHMISVSKNLKQAFARAKMLAQPGDRIVLFGSFHVAGELLPRLQRQTYSNLNQPEDDSDA
jgi:dihydrofolate synthase/folylpolyglutamate synthase